MRKWIVLLALLPHLIDAPLAFGIETGMQVRMKTDLEVIHNVFQTQYAPIHWKMNEVGWSLPGEMALARAKIESKADISIKDYQRILKDFFYSLHDYHASINFYSTEAALLPFQLRSTNGRYFITGIDKEELPPELRTLQVGDEVLEFDGMPIDLAFKRFEEEELAPHKTATDRAFGEIFFTARFGAEGHLVPKGACAVKIDHRGTRRIKEYRTEWIYSAEEVANISLPLPYKGINAGLKNDFVPAFTSPNLSTHPALSKSMLAPLAEKLKVAPSVLEGHGLGARKSFVPALGRILWESSEEIPFHAYLFEAPFGAKEKKRKIGYLRIPDYVGSAEEVEQFRDIMERFEEESAALVIDQVNNLGGQVFYMYALASILSDSPLEVPMHRISLTQQEVAFAVDCIPELEAIQSEEEAHEVVGYSLNGLPVSMKTVQHMLDYFREIVDEWSLGNTFTKPLYLWGIDRIDQDPFVRYTKPILILVNELDLSCGDFFPAIMQDNGRALLFGACTGGAGGFVLSSEHPNLFGIKRVTYTGSLAERPSGNLIENVGVRPDIAYALKEEDFINGYRHYANAVLEALAPLLGGH